MPAGVAPAEGGVSSAQNPGGYSGRPIVAAPRSDYGSRIAKSSGILNLSIGGRRLEDSRWVPLEEQLAGSLDYTFKAPDWLIGLNVGLYGGGIRQTLGATDVDAWQAEVCIGPRLYLPIPKTPLYIYGGVSAAIAYGELEFNSTQRITDTFFAGVASAGLMWKLNRNQAIGLEWRTLQGSDIAEIPTAPNDANHQQISLTFSAAF